MLLGGPFGKADPGEEAQLAAFRTSFPDWRVIALSSSPRETSARHGCEAIDPADPSTVGRIVPAADALVLLGDRVFNPGRSPSVSLWAQQARSLAVGLSNSASAGPLVFLGAGLSVSPNGSSERGMLRTLIRRSSLLVLRDQQSAASLTEAGLPGPFRVGSDLAWLSMPPVRRAPSPRRGNVLVIVSHQLAADQTARMPKVLQPVVEQGLDVSLQPWQRHSGPLMDMSLAGTLSADLNGAEVLRPTDDLEESLSRMAEADVTICTNLHSLIAAGLARVPAVAIGDDPQVAALAGRLGLHVIPVDEGPTEIILALEEARPAPLERVEDQIVGAAKTRHLLKVFLEGPGATDDVPQLALEPPPWDSNGPNPETSAPQPDSREKAESGGRSSFRLTGLLSVVLMLLALVGAALFASAVRAPPSAVEASMTAIDRYFDGYLTDEGRVTRPENGGDTTSEGQAYAMLLAVAAGDRGTFDLVWGWTVENLRQQSGSLAWHWGRGTVLDPQPAPDADLDAAMALLIASRRFSEPEYRSEALRLARATLETSTIKRSGQLYLTAGPWANGPPTYVNPSYQPFRALSEFAASTSDPRWDELSETGLEIVDSLAEPNTGLMPDWGELTANGEMRPVPKPGTNQTQPAYGFDAVRTPIRLFHSCNQLHRNTAATLWPFLEDRLEQGTLESVFTLDGRPMRDDQHATSMIGAAAAAAAAGETSRARDLVDRAEGLVGDADSYGAAWVALGRVILTTDLLGGCSGRG